MDTAPSNQPEPAEQNPSPLATQGEEEAWDERRCGRGKADGTRCKAFKVKGEDACAGHLGLGIGKDPAAYAREAASASAQARSDRAEERKKRVKDRLADAVEGDLADAIIAAYRKGLESDDPATAMRAAEGILSRVYGKPKEIVEQTVTKPEEIARLDQLSDEELWALFRTTGDVTAA